MKRGGRLYFSKADLHLWLKEGKHKTHAEINAEADLHILNQKNKRQNPTSGKLKNSNNL